MSPCLGLRSKTWLQARAVPLLIELLLIKLLLIKLPLTDLAGILLRLIGQGRLLHLRKVPFELLSFGLIGETKVRRRLISWTLDLNGEIITKQARLTFSEVEEKGQGHGPSPHCSLTRYLG